LSLNLGPLQSFISPSFNRIAPFLKTGLGAVILSVCGWQAGALVATSLQQNAPVTLSNRQVENWLIAGQRPVSTPNSLAYDRLFARQDIPDQAVVVPKTPLKMVLSAVFVAPENKDSGAIIATLNRTAHYYKVGDNVEGNIHLSSVQEDHVVLDRDGNAEALYFKEKKPGAKGALSPAVGAPPRQLPSRQVGAVVPRKGLPPELQSLPDTELGADIRRLNSTAFMRKYQQKFQEDPQALLMQAGMSPAPGGGYEVGNSPYASLLTSAGLEMGDVILSVNGNSLGSPQNDAQLLGQLSQQKEVEVLIQRGSRQFAVSFPISR